MANKIGLLLISFILFSRTRGIDLIPGKKCKFEHKYVCGIQDCNCRYVSQNGVSTSSLYRRFMAMFSQNNDEGQVCDKCDAFCSTVKHINCQHGSCDKQKGCICRDCWSGESCSKYKNNQPEFKELLYVAKINKDTNVDEKILKVSAIDSDMETCVDKYNCPCGRVKYSINKGNEDGLFYINPASGVISLTRKLDQYDLISLTIAAENEGDLNTVEDNHGDKALATVVITVENDELENVVRRERRSLHHRARRSAVTTYDALEIIFAPVTNETFFAAGCTVNFRLYLVQNSSAAPQNLSDMNIQLRSENPELGDNGYSVNISNANHSSSFDLVRINSDTVKFTIAGPMGINDSMEIKFHGRVRTTSDPLALLQVAFTMNATASGPVTYGPKYSNEIYTTYPEIKLARTSVGVVNVETTLNYNVNVTLPYFNFTFILVITTNVNDFRFLSIENVQLGNVSDSVKYAQVPTPTMYTGAEDDITSRVVLNFGKISVLNRDQSANTIKLSFSVKVGDYHSLENGSTHWVGVGSYVGKDMLEVTQGVVTIFKDKPSLFAEIKALDRTDQQYYINDEIRFSWLVEHGNGSYETAKLVRVKFYFPKSLSFDVNKISGLNGTITLQSDEIKQVLVFQPSGGSLLQSDSLRGNITVKVSDMVTPLADLNVEIKIYYKGSNGERRPIKTYKSNPGYYAGAPSFNLSADQTNMTIKIGEPFEITLKMVVRKMTLDGNLKVLLPVKNNSAIIGFVATESFSNIFLGANLEAPAYMNAKPMFNSTTNETTYYDSAKLDLGSIKNKNSTTSATDEIADNTATLTFKVVLADNVYVENRANYTIVIAIESGEHTLWVGHMIFTADVLLIRRPKLQIIPLSNGSDTLIQGSVVEYNFTISHKDDSEAHAMDVEVVWMFPAYTKYLRVNQNSHQLTLTKLQNNIMFTLNKLVFSEKPFVSFSVAMDPDKVRTKYGKNYAVTPVALSYKNKQTFFEPLVPISVAFIVPEPLTFEPVPSNVPPEFYNRGYLVDNTSSTVYICSVSSRRDKPSCLWTNTKGETWQAVQVFVVNIIGIDHATKIVYGIGNNKMAYMKYLPDEEKWYSIVPDNWKKINATLPLYNKPITIQDSYAHEVDPASDKQWEIGSGEKWGANKLGVFHFSTQNGWTRKASWGWFR